MREIRNEYATATILRRAGAVGKMAGMRVRLAMLLLFTLSSAMSALALPLTPFRYADQAQRHCPADTVVWLDFARRLYYSKAQRRYGQGANGSYVCRSEARESGYRRSVMGLR